MSPRRLGLRILCEDGAPIESILSFWPNLPLFVRLKGPKSKSLPNNITIALRHPDRVCEIDLVLPSSLMGPIVEVVQEPFQALECIRITVAVENATGPPIVSREAFLGGSAPLLREIKLDGIAFPFPAIQQVLLSTNSLVELHIASIPNDVLLSPRDLATSLSTLTHLERLTVGFHSAASSRQPPSMIRPPRRTTLPSLTSLEFCGASEYLEGFVTRLDLPALCKIKIILFNDILFEIPQLCQFIPRLNALRSPTRVIVTHSIDSVSVFFVQEGDRNCLLKTSCRRLDWQLSFVTQISNQLSPLLSTVQSLSITAGLKWPSEEGDMDSIQWLELFRPFTHLTQVNVSEKQFVPDVVKALVAEDMAAGVLPELTSLFLSGYYNFPTVAKTVEQFVATRGLSGRTIRLIS